jgi:toxin ParE1/3/4
MAQVIRSELARRDALEIWVNVAEGNFDAADRLMDRFEEVLNDLAETPGMGRSRDEYGQGLRSFPVGDYLLFYHAVPGGIEVVRIVHGARDLPGLFGRGS